MPARIAATLTLKIGPDYHSSVLICLLFYSFLRPAPWTDHSHSPGWVVLPVDEYRTLHARPIPSNADPEPPPVEPRSRVLITTCASMVNSLPAARA